MKHDVMGAILWTLGFICLSVILGYAGKIFVDVVFLGRAG